MIQEVIITTNFINKPFYVKFGLHVLPVHAWVYSGQYSFLTVQNMLNRLFSYHKLTLAVH